MKPPMEYHLLVYSCITHLSYFCIEFPSSSPIHFIPTIDHHPTVQYIIIQLRFKYICKFFPIHIFPVPGNSLVPKPWLLPPMLPIHFLNNQPKICKKNPSF